MYVLGAVCIIFWKINQVVEKKNLRVAYFPISRHPLVVHHPQVHLGVRCDDLIEAGAKAAGGEEGDGGFNPRCHYAVVADWSKPIDAAGNVIVVSIPSVLDPSLAPPGCHTVHAYT